ncbi:hypothetical protein GLOIN_2v1881393 [Rhizophagus irregularis DAOM 181602=DAOM 197198]|nr:hypothetical protein GLOIN_2v1881393 [Rhizophagus irregularis DAOM 181602=DAOM 197198]
MESAYKFTEYRYRFLKETKNLFSADSRIRKDAVRRKEAISEIVLKCIATSFDVYIDEIKRLSWENSKLREELRKTSHVMVRKGNEEKRKEQIISQKNEQIRKISQKIEKTSLELKKAKTGNNKNDAQPKKGKIGKRSGKIKKWKAIIEIPVLPEIPSDDPNFNDARDIFFYDIPKYWSEEEIRTNLMKIGKVVRIQTRGQFKYKTVKVKLVLNKNFEKTFKEGHFGICISKHFIRWYDAKIDLKGRQERDRWQAVRDLTNKEMDEIKTGSIYDFTKQTKRKWRKSCTQGDINWVWLVRNKKTIYREDRKNKENQNLEPEKKKVEPVKITETALLNDPPSPIRSKRLIPRANVNFSRQEPKKTKSPEEEKVVEMIKKWRLNEEAEHQLLLDQFDKGQQSSKALNKDNVAPEEVVEIIKDYRSEKIVYERFKDSTKRKDICGKMDKIKDIFIKTSNGMEWEKINAEAVTEMKNELKIEGMENFNQWIQKENNYLLLKKKIINKKEVGDKRPILELPSPSTVKTAWLIDMSENEEDGKEQPLEITMMTTPNPIKKKNKRKGKKKK